MKHGAQEPPALEMDGPSDGDLLRAHHSGQRVLLAEDNPVNQLVASDLLTSVGLTVEVAQDGLQAVALALSRPYDLILMDMQMPVMDGMGASRAIRDGAGAATPIIAMTSNASGADRAACLAAGMDEHLAKPVSAGTLFSTLLRWLPVPGAATPLATTPPAHRAGGQAPMPGPGLLPRLSQLEGFDPGEVVLNLGGRLDSLQRVVASFVAAYRHPVFETLARGDSSGPCREACHVLRGEYVLLGSADLTCRLEALERNLRSAGDPHETLLLARQLDDGLAGLASRLCAALGAEPGLRAGPT